jgi:hypothetical protein
LDVLLISGIILVAGLLFLGWFTKRYSDFWFKILVSNEAELVNEILGSEELPAKWRLSLVEKAAKHDHLSGLGLFLKRWYLYKLDRLIRSVQHSSYINKDLKAEYLEALQEIRAEWQERRDLF